MGLGQSNMPGAGPLPRGACPACGRDVALRRGGELREHRPGADQLELEPGLYKCPGSGYTIDQVEQRIAGEIDALRSMSR